MDRVEDEGHDRIDPLLGTDWAAHWRGLVEGRIAALGPRGEDYWDVRAPAFRAATQGGPGPFMDVLEPYLVPTRTLIDVGAGYGRFAVPLAGRLDWVTAVEPSAGMREGIPHVDNMTVVGSSWEEAEVQPADLVICVHVLYPVTDPVPFLEKLERAATERVFVVLRDARLTHPAEAMAGEAVPREPWLRDAFCLLRSMGITPDISYRRFPSVHRYPSMEEALRDCRSQLGPLWDEVRGRAFLEANLRQEADGTLAYEVGAALSGVLHWRPRERG